VEVIQNKARRFKMKKILYFVTIIIFMCSISAKAEEPLTALDIHSVYCLKAHSNILALSDWILKQPYPTIKDKNKIQLDRDKTNRTIIHIERYLAVRGLFPIPIGTSVAMKIVIVMKQANDDFDSLGYDKNAEKKLNSCNYIDSELPF
jgi:hypothetical protein